jgi:hypothetical protein
MSTRSEFSCHTADEVCVADPPICASQIEGVALAAVLLRRVGTDAGHRHSVQAIGP